MALSGKFNLYGFPSGEPRRGGTCGRVELREVNSLVPEATQATPPPSPPARTDGLVDSYRRLAEVFHDVLSEQSLDRARADRRHARRPHPLRRLHDLPGRRGRGALLIPVMARDRWADEIMSDQPPYGDGLTGWAVEHGEAQLVNQAHLDPRAKVVPGTPADEPEALISVPLVARGTVKGALNVYRLGRTPRLHRGGVRAGRSASATRPRSRSTTPRFAPASSTRRRPTRSRASTTTATSTSGCAPS